MAEVFFYHLTTSTAEQTLSELCMKCVGRNWRVLVHCGQADKIATLDAALWQRGPDDGFLAHGQAGQAHDADQPILLSPDGRNANTADVLVLLDGATANADEIGKYQRTCLLFDGNNERAVTAARADWLRIKAADIPAQYWSQADGGWKMKQKTGG